MPLNAVTTLLRAFRPIGGSGNNAANLSFNLPPGTTELRIAPNVPGQLTDPTLPNPRTVSNVVSGGAQALANDPTRSAWFYAFGQFLDHDVDKEADNAAVNVDVKVPAGDPVLQNGTVIPLGGSAGPTAVNTVAGFLDLSQLYGSDAATAASLRNADGTLKTSAGNNLSIVGGQFVAGDARVMENPELTAVTTLFMREHNFQVGQLRLQHPLWTGDQLYNMAKAITTAEYENITYTQYLPALIGNVGPYTGYNPSVSANASQEFTAAAFRVGHSQVSGQQAGIDNNGNITFTESLAASFSNTPAQDVANGFDNLLRNLSNDYSQATDTYVVDQLRNTLAAPPQAIDLIAIDIQRERDLGLGTLNQTRAALGLTAYTSFAQITSDPAVQANLKTAFGTVDKVDLFEGGLAENHVAGSAVGQTFQAILARQFSALRTGDAFWWQNQGFDPQTAKTIAATTLGGILERDTNTTVEQQNVFVTQQRHASNVAAAVPTAPQLVIGIDGLGAKISGGPADDTIVAGSGLGQILTGAGGSNVFVFNGLIHIDTISDFHAATDKIEFQGAIASLLPSDHISVHAASPGSKTSSVVTFLGDRITLPGVSANSVTAANFILPPGVNITIDHALA